MKREDLRMHLFTWWNSLTIEEKKLLPIIQDTINLRDLFSEAPISYKRLRETLKQDINKIEAELKVLGVIFDVDVYRKHLLNWWKSLTDEQKESLPTSNGTIDIRNLFNDAPITHSRLRQLLKEEINKIDADLKSLGVLFDIEAYREHLFNWWNSLTDEQKKAVPIWYQSIDLRDLFSDALIGYKSIRIQLKEDINKINAELKALGVLFDIEAYRERLLNWWKSLTDEQKKLLPTPNGTIDLRNLFNDAPITHSRLRQLLKEEINKIDAELKAIGVLFDIEAYRERLLNWWLSLTDDQKKAAPTSMQSIDLKNIFSGSSVSYKLIRKYLREDINKIDEELKALGILVDIEACRERLLNWWRPLTDDEKKSVPVTHLSVNLHGLLSDVPMNHTSVRQHLKDEIDKIDEELKTLGVLFDIEAYKERLNTWWKSLTDDQKKSVQTSRNTINLRDLFSGSQFGYFNIRQQLKEDINKIDEELKTLGVLFDIEAYRVRLNSWWKSLTDDQKKSVLTTNNSISLRELFRDAPVNYVSIRRRLKEDIKKIDEELKSLGVLLNVDDEVIVTLMRNFLSECEANPERLWDVEFSVKGLYLSKLQSEDPASFFEQYGFVSTVYLANKLSCKVKKIESPALLELRKQLNQLLLKYEVSLPYSQINGSSHSVGFDLNNRRVFLKWKNSLTDEDKLALPMHGKLIASKTFQDLIPTENRATTYPLLKTEFQRFSSELVKLKDIDYKTLKEREEIRKQKVLEKEDSRISVFYKMRDKRLISIEDFSSEKGIYEDVLHAFAVGSLKSPSRSRIKSYFYGLNHYCDLLESKDILPETSFRECFDSWSLRDFKEHLGDKIEKELISTSTANTYLSALRMTLEKLKTIRNFDYNYYPADGFEIVINSKTYKPYSPNERKQIHDMLEQEIALVKNKLEPYKKIDREYVNLDDSKIKARIIFEDHCNCVPCFDSKKYRNKDRTKGQHKFINFVRARRFYLNDLYDEWGVLTKKVTSRELGVYVLKMAQVLGMNLSPIIDLELDDYQDRHPLTNKPCLTYWKERSTGEKMLHLDLFNADLQWLTVSQKHFVESVFEEVTLLTSEARKFAPDEISNRLFLTLHKGNNGRCCKLSMEGMSKFYSELVDEYQLKGDDGEPMVLTTTRFRPTLVSELVDAGVSIREIQYLLGHASIYTTIGYLEKLDFDRVIRDKARKAIEDIYSNTVHATKHNSSKKQPRRFDENQIIMKTPLGGCKNIFDPPNFIKKSSLYVKGKPCSQYNKCLSCENVMLTEKHLPELFAMQRDYLASLESSTVVNTPYHVVVLENLSLLDDILNPETSEFEEEVLSQAKEDSLFIETTILDSWGV
ncbi:tyrosine-type recombinase/integrase [uncultured Psychromonas sp.]|uniref:tyrosine-type recombinase/integrase n=1 Tax=uncultured Psychromonas sp. TaxID=173974 RepID=UPI00262D500A|nr:tyrosine-type recombinase/integrase [uncultured Psychromonas sp.]